jgi:hypothetical protein
VRDSILGERSSVAKASQIADEVLEDGSVIEGMVTESGVLREGMT